MYYGLFEDFPIVFTRVRELAYPETKRYCVGKVIKIQTVGTATKLNETVLNRLQEGIIILLPQQIQKEVRIDNCGF